MTAILSNISYKRKSITKITFKRHYLPSEQIQLAQVAMQREKVVESPNTVENMAEKSTESKTQINLKTLIWATLQALDSREDFRSHGHPNKKN